MENGPETTSQTPTTASSTDEVMVSDASAAETVANDAAAVVVDAETLLDAATDAGVSGTETVFSDDETVDIVAERVTEPEDLPDTEAREFQEAPAPQPVHMFDLGDDLGVHPEAPAFDMAEETVEPMVSHEVADEPDVSIQSDDVEAEATIALETIQEPISIISGRIVCSQPPRLSTPSMVNKLEPTPVMFAPIELSILHNCCKYGSQAAL